MNVLPLLAPDLCLIALGYLLSRRGSLGRPFWDGFEGLVYYVLLPALLLQSILNARLSIGVAGPALAAVTLATLIGIALVWLSRWLLHPDPILLASGGQCAYRFNTYLALALTQRVAGDEGLGLCAVILAFMVPLANVAAVHALARHANASPIRELARNPLMVACLLGLAGNVMGLSLPGPIAVMASRLSSAALPCGLLTVGAGLVFQRDSSAIRQGAHALMAWLTSIKLLLMPAIAYALSLAWHLEPAAQATAVIFCAVSTASSTYVLAARMGGDGPYTAKLCSVTMLASVATLPLWMALIS